MVSEGWRGFICGMGITTLAAAFGLQFWVKPALENARDGLQSCASSLEEAAANLGTCADDIRACADNLKKAQEEAPELKIQLRPWNHQYHVFFSAKQTKDGENITYRLTASPNKVYPGELGEEPSIDVTQVFEELYIERADGTMISYSDGDLGVQVQDDSCWAGPRDGLVDSIVVYQPGKGSTLFCRVRDFDSNPTVFESADARFNEVRAQYFDSE